MGDRFDLRGAHVSGSAVGSHSRVYHQSGPGLPVADLLAALAAARADIVAAAPEADRDEVRAEVGKIEEELQRDTPRGTVVANRWQTVTTVVGAISEPLVKITELITKLFG
ncbi:hypothetical protein DMA12_07730 [Amycolatopsis balhimycina DSM 5908]|uniref:DUF4404 family protein n=1 Tax=Amycolatopsis balhimycina DSM 5908 TaxID=1081091 RepID=A0A428WXR4_AMYBA|nr:hypothetical protein [Amycolatopsis balhimycina]RSM47849.1 hypothetical protein DMA12_07730 [Amycolatopsis balhimycina DSM 5908]